MIGGHNKSEQLCGCGNYEYGRFQGVCYRGAQRKGGGCGIKGYLYSKMRDIPACLCADKDEPGGRGRPAMQQKEESVQE